MFLCLGIGCLTGRILLTQRLKARSCSGQHLYVCVFIYLFIYLSVCAGMYSNSLVSTPHTLNLLLICAPIHVLSSTESCLIKRWINKRRSITTFSNNGLCGYYLLNMYTERRSQAAARNQHPNPAAQNQQLEPSSPKPAVRPQQLETRSLNPAAQTQQLEPSSLKPAAQTQQLKPSSLNPAV